MPSGPPRFIQVGTGGWGRRWCETFLKRLVDLGRARPVAAVDRDPAALEHARAAFGIPEDACYTSAEEAFARHPAEFAAVVVPPAHHEELVRLAFAHGCDVVCEKPLADSIEASARILLAAQAAGRRLAVTMSHRFDQDKQTLERVVRSGEFGRLHYVVGRLHYNLRHRGEWGAFRHEIEHPLLLEGAVHQFDVARALTGADAATVYATTWNPPWGEYAGDSTALVVATMTNGVRVLYEGAKANAATLSPWEGEYWRAECEHATLELDRRRLRAWSRGPGGPDDVVVREIALDERPAWANSWLVEQFVDWLEGGPPPPTQVSDNIQCAALTFAAVESAVSGRPVDVQAFLADALSRST
ncbi:MAG TPA: Gfo/Idh/MocA family oxidoreductase [Gaiellaceae bacterium]|nr:Gfo/Idh/MocA family oxidoreductase [Gaiellaceae bacterium]